MEFINLLANISVLSIILFIVGIGLIVVELFEPGFGIFGALGVICLIICIFVTAQTVVQGVIMTAVFFVIILIVLGIFLNVISKGRLPKKMILQESMTAEQGFSGSDDMSFLLGKKGEVLTGCRPAGIVDFNGFRYDVVSRGEFIEKGVSVMVVEIEGNRIVVKEV